MEVRITPTLPVYHRAETRLYLLKGKLGLNDTVLEPLAVEPSTDLFQWPNLEELYATYQENPSLSTEQTDSDTMTSSSRGSEMSGNGTASRSEGNRLDWTLDPAADRGIAIGG